MPSRASTWLAGICFACLQSRCYFSITVFASVPNEIFFPNSRFKDIPYLINACKPPPPGSLISDTKLQHNKNFVRVIKKNQLLCRSPVWHSTKEHKWDPPKSPHGHAAWSWFHPQYHTDFHVCTRVMVSSVYNGL